MTILNMEVLYCLYTEEVRLRHDVCYAIAWSAAQYITVLSEEVRLRHDVCYAIAWSAAQYITVLSVAQISRMKTKSHAIVGMRQCKILPTNDKNSTINRIVLYCTVLYSSCLGIAKPA
jgi:glycogen debranching enzyme